MIPYFPAKKIYFIFSIRKQRGDRVRSEAFDCYFSRIRDEGAWMEHSWQCKISVGQDTCVFGVVAASGTIINTLLVASTVHTLREAIDPL